MLVARNRVMVTIAYDAATGRQLWRSRNPDPAAHDAGTDVVTVAYDLAGGAQQWVARYTAAAFDTNTPRSLAPSDDGTVFTTLQVAHNSQLDSSNANHYDVATLAHGATPSPVVPEGPPWLLLAGGVVAAAGYMRRRPSSVRELLAES